MLEKIIRTYYDAIFRYCYHHDRNTAEIHAAFSGGAATGCSVRRLCGGSCFGAAWKFKSIRVVSAGLF